MYKRQLPRYDELTDNAKLKMALQGVVKEEEYAKTETPVVSNNSAHRWTKDVPMVVPEINACLLYTSWNWMRMELRFHIHK